MAQETGSLMNTAREADVIVVRAKGKNQKIITKV
jgi:hypothetical protein